MTVLYHIFLLFILILITNFILYNIFSRSGKKDSFQHQFLYLLLIGLYFLILLDYEYRNGQSVRIPIQWNLGDLLIATFLSISGLIILLWILWFDYSYYQEQKKRGASPSLDEETLPYGKVTEWSLILLLATLSGIIEEFIFRYYIIDRMSWLTPHLDWSVGLSSVLYGLVYYTKSGWMSVCFRGILGFLLSVLLILTGNLIFVIFVHIAWNVIVFSITSNQLDQFFNKLWKTSSEPSFKK